jgi:hypothetical protein
MSVSTVDNGNAAAFAQMNSSQGSSAGAANTDNAGGATQASTSASATTSATQSSTKVTLSEGAQALARLNEAGITMTQTSIDALDLPTSFNSSEAYTLIALALKKAAVTPPTGSDGKTDGAVSEKGFEGVAKQFGATQTQADQLFQSMDSNGDGSMTNDELLSALSGSADNSDSSAAQALLTLMDTNSDSSVGSSEYLKFETAFVAAEKAPS